MKWRMLTVLVILLAPFALLAYDLVAYVVAGNEATISREALETDQRYRLFSFALIFLFGLLCGHLFLPQHVAAK